MIACEGDPTDYIYAVVSGVVRSCRTYRDGSRGIVGFHLQGEFFGWSGDLVHSLALRLLHIHSCCFSNAAPCLLPPCRIAEWQIIF